MNGRRTLLSLYSPSLWQISTYLLMYVIWPTHHHRAVRHTTGWRGISFQPQQQQQEIYRYKLIQINWNELGGKRRRRRRRDRRTPIIRYGLIYCGNQIIIYIQFINGHVFVHFSLKFIFNLFTIFTSCRITTHMYTGTQK